ncbi:hypothetical protein BDF19DRAFT_422274 [Syncephalis fuscata]|nr:hypothetical protein BDF19DRAFT_422274 [Syncephalis fuscata]
MLLKAWAAFAQGKTPLPPLHNRQLLRLEPNQRHLVNRPLPATKKSQTKSDTTASRRLLILCFSPDSFAKLKADAIKLLSENERDMRWFSMLDVVELCYDAQYFKHISS